MTTYNVELVVNGRDNASGPLGSVGGALENIGQITGGILGADLLQRIAGGIMDIGSEALSSYANYEQLGFSLNSLTARELMNSTAVTTQTESTRAATQAEIDRNTWLKENLVAQEQGLHKLQAGSDAYLKQQEQINATQGQIDALNISQNGYITTTETATKRTMDMATALGLTKDRTKELLDWTQQVAVHSPFKQEDIANTLQMAMGFGFSSQQAQRMTGDLVDYAAATGKSGDVIQRMTLALGEMNTTGKLGGLQMRELAIAGLPMKQILADGLHVSTEQLNTMISKGLIPASQAFDILSKSIETDFGGAAARQAGTFSGLMTSLNDLKDIGLREFFTGTFQAAQPYLQKFVDTLSSPEFTANLDAAGAGLGVMVGTVLSNGSTIVGAVGNWIGGFQDLSKQPTFVIDAMRNMQVGMDIFGNFWTMNGPAITTIAGGLFKNIGDTAGFIGSQIIPMVTQAFQNLSVWFYQNGPLIQQFFAQFALDIQVLMMVVKALWVFFQPILAGIIQLVMDMAKLMMQIAVGDWSGAWKTMGDIANHAGSAIQQAFSNLATWVTSWFGTSWAKVQETWKNNYDMFIETWKNGKLQAYFKKIWDDGIAGWQSFFTGLWGKFVEGWNNGLAGWGRFFAGLWSQFVTSWNNGLAGWGRFFSGLWQQFVTGWNNGLAGWARFFSSLYQQFVTAWNNGLAGWGTFFAGVLTLVTNSISGFVTVGQQICDGLLKGIQDNIGEVTGYLQGVIDDLIAGIKNTLGIHSPSAVFAGFGKNMMAGMTQGFNEEGDKPAASMKKHIGNVVAAANPASSGGSQAQSSSGSGHSSGTQHHSHFGTINISVKDQNEAKKFLKDYRP